MRSPSSGLAISVLSLPLGRLRSFVASFKVIMNDCIIPVILLTEMDYRISAKCITYAPKAFS